MFSGVTDCYQPLEASYRLTRGCLEVCVEHANPAAHHHQVGADRTRRRRAARAGARRRRRSSRSASRSGTRSARARSSRTSRRRRAGCASIETLARAGLSVGVNVAPIIPGLNDQDIPKILAAARDAGATSGGLRARAAARVGQAGVRAAAARALPLVADRVLHRIRETRGGQLYDSRFGARGAGRGTYADAIRTLFETTAARLGIRTRHGHGRRRGPRQVSVDDVQDDGEAAVAQRKRADVRVAAGPADASRHPSVRGRHDGGAPAAKVRA